MLPTFQDLKGCIREGRMCDTHEMLFWLQCGKSRSLLNLLVHGFSESHMQPPDAPLLRNKYFDLRRCPFSAFNSCQQKQSLLGHNEKHSQHAILRHQSQWVVQRQLEYEKLAGSSTIRLRDR
jgi:hypothetical protein